MDPGKTMGGGGLAGFCICCREGAALWRVLRAFGTCEVDGREGPLAMVPLTGFGVAGKRC